MGDFITNPASTLPADTIGEKTGSDVPVGADPTRYIRAPDFNEHGARIDAAHQALLDTREAVLARVVADGGDASALVVTPTGSTTPRTLAARHADVVNVKDFGAVGDGVADDTAEIQAAITAAAGRVTLIPKGTYRTTATLNLPSGAIVSAYGAVLLFDNQDLQAPAIQLSGVAGVSIMGLEVDGQKALVVGETEFKSGVDIKSSTDITLRDLYLHDCKGDGIYIGAAEGLTPNERISAHNVWCDANYRQGITITSAKALRFVSCRGSGSTGTAPQSGLDIEPNFDTDTLEDIRFVACEFSGNAGEGITGWSRLTPTSPQGDVKFTGCSIRGNGTSGCYLRYVRDWSFVDCDFIGNGQTGIAIDNNPRRVSITGGTIRGNGTRGVSAVITATFTATDLSLSGVKIYDNGLSSPGTLDGVRVDGTVDGFRMVDCFTGNVDTSGQRYGVTTGAATVTNVRILGTRASGNASGSSLFSDNSGSRVLWGNTGIDNVLAPTRRAVTYSASMTPNAGAGSDHTITATDGTAFTINTATGAAAGLMLSICVRNASAAPLGTATWSSGYKMAAWTNPAAGYSRSISFVHDGTNWIERSRTPEDVPN